MASAVEAPSPSRLDAQERAARGRAARRRSPRSGLAAFEAAADRPDPVSVLEQENRTRVPDLLPIRHGRMLRSPFAFFRGGAAIMAGDLAPGPTSGIVVQACGDAHLANFGAFAAPDRRLVFDVNDFDETLPAPWEWDVKRLSASIAVAGRDRGFGEPEREEAVRAAAEGYRTAMRELAAMRDLDVWYARVEVEPLLERLRGSASQRALARTRRNVARARRKDSLRALRKLTQNGQGDPHLINDPPLLVPARELVPSDQADALIDRMEELLRSYRASLRSDVRHLLSGYRFVDLAHKVVGVGSVGRRAWIILLLGRDQDDPLFLQAKEAEQSSLEPFAGRSAYRNHGRRVVEGQRLMQAAGDVTLGWLRATGPDGGERDFYLRQLWDAKASAEIESMEPPALTTYARLCGGVLARAHARSGDRIAIASYLGSGSGFDRAMAAFAETYADRNERDYEAFATAVAGGRLEARTGI